MTNKSVYKSLLENHGNSQEIFNRKRSKEKRESNEHEDLKEFDVSRVQKSKLASFDF